MGPELGAFKPNKTLTRSPPPTPVAHNVHSTSVTTVEVPQITFDLGFDYSSESDNEQSIARHRSSSLGSNVTSNANDQTRMDLLKTTEASTGAIAKGKRKLSGGRTDSSKTKKKNNSHDSGTSYVGLEAVPAISVSNRYHALSDDESEVTEIPASDEINTNEKENNTQPKQAKPPPIVLRNAKDFMSLAQNVKLVCVGDPIFQCRGDITRLLTRDSDDHRAATAWLRANGTEFHTYQLSEDRKAQLVIRGLPASIKPDQIKAELNNVKISAENVTQIVSTKPDKKLMPLFIITISKEDAPLLTELKTLCYCRITFEKYINPKGPAQCYHCQKFGHTARYCANAPRCVKCGRKHESKTCVKTYEEPVKCSNCDGNHTANYKGCTYYKNVRNKMNGVRTGQTPKTGPNTFRPSAPPTINPWNNNAQRNLPSSSASQTVHFPSLPQPQHVQPSIQPMREQPSNTQYNQSQHQVPNMDFQGIILWAKTLMSALEKARPEDTLNVIISHAMPLMLVQSIINTNNGQP